MGIIISIRANLSNKGIINGIMSIRAVNHLSFVFNSIHHLPTSTSESFGFIKLLVKTAHETTMLIN